MLNEVHFQNKTYSPSKIICIGRNYVDHIKELDNEIPSEPVIFLKPNSAISEHLYIHASDVIHYEGEICFIIESGELSGVGFGLDLTKRDMQSILKKKGLPWERSKAFNHSALFSCFVPLTEPINKLRMELYINDRITQQGGYDLMLNKPDDLLKEIDTFMSFEDGDIVMTGTPKGVGTVNSEDKFVGKIFSGDTLLVEHFWIAQ